MCGRRSMCGRWLMCGESEAVNVWGGSQCMGRRSMCEQAFPSYLLIMVISLALSELAWEDRGKGVWFCTALPAEA